LAAVVDTAAADGVMAAVEDSAASAAEALAVAAQVDPGKILENKL
jgi:hypothetical protein